MKFNLATALLMAVASCKAAEVSFFTGPDCDQNTRFGDVLTVPDDSGNIADVNFNDEKPISMLVIGWAEVLLKKNTNDIFDQPTCGYCANYYTQHGTVDNGCRNVDDGQKCVNIDTGFAIGHAKLIAVGSPSPADLPCQNYAVQCPWSDSAANGFCSQAH